MKKIISILLTSTVLIFFAVANSMADWTAGFSVTHGEYTANGSESENGSITYSSDQAKAVTYPSVFIEKTLDWNGVSVGLDIIPASQESEEATRTDINIGDTQKTTGNDGGASGVTNKAKVELSQHVTAYAIVPVMDTGAFARLGVQTVNVETKEQLATGSAYPDKRIFGGTVGLGYQHETAVGFIRAEVGHSIYEEFTLTSTTNTDNKVTADLDGTFARISVGMAF